LSQIELSFVLPAYNEEDYIEDTIGKIEVLIKGKNLPYEIVVVDDGSIDGTLCKVVRCAKRNEHVRVVSYVENVGKGHAVKTGFMQAFGNTVVFVDSDMEINLESISKYLEALKQGADIVIASKRHSDSRVQVSLTRKILSISFNGLVRFLTGIPLNDTQSGLKAMKKNAFEDIFPRLAVKKYAFDVELLAVAHLYGLKIVEMPVTIKIDVSFNLKQIWNMFVDLLGIAYRLRLVHWYQRELPSKNSFQEMVSALLREQ
jgi:glycosyltransferase involved in cell wall biosynthesis